MIGHPMETEKTLKETTEFLKKLRLHCFHVTFFTPLPGAPIYDEIDKYGKFDRNFEGLTYWHKVFIPNGVSRELMDYYERKMYSSFYLRPRILLHYLSRVYEPAYWGKLFKASYTLLKIVMGHDRK